MSEPKRKFVPTEADKKTAESIMEVAESDGYSENKDEEEGGDDEKVSEVPCKYCGALVALTSDVNKCPSCGAPLKLG
jgi:rubrerythrin